VHIPFHLFQDEDIRFLTFDFEFMPLVPYFIQVSTKILNIVVHFHNFFNYNQSIWTNPQYLSLIFLNYFVI
jgi:hypothetical protein